MRSAVKTLTLAGILISFLESVYGAGEISVQQHAAEEFAGYVAKITGTAPRVEPGGLCTLRKSGVRVVIGRSAVTARLTEKGLLEIPEDLGEDGFVIKSVQEDQTNYLVLVGGSPRAALYAVYHYLETFCRVGFFGDGEQIPSLDAIPTAGIDLIERPRWPVRQYMMDCEYTSYWWGPEEWKREVDWAAKHKFNVLSSNFDFTATWRRVWKRFGVDVPPESLTGPPFHPWGGWHNWAMKPPYPVAFQQCQADMAEQFVDYGRSLGIKMAPDFTGFLGQVPREFCEAYRDRARFIEVGWVGFEPPGVFVHPEDPLYGALAKAFAEEYVKRYGTDHLWAGQSSCEMLPAEDPEETLAIEITLAKKNLAAIRSVDPEAVLFTNSWTFLDRSKENVKAFLDALPNDGYQVWEMPSDFQSRQRQYRELDYFHGKTWLFGFLHSYGGTTMLHGDLADLIRRGQEVAEDPKADKCLGMGIQPEALRHNYVVFDLLSRVGWDPRRLELDSFLTDYATRRYGTESAPRMVECFKELAASVYGQPGSQCPLYMIRIRNQHLDPQKPYGVDQAKRFLPHLEIALEIALEESDRLQSSPLYQHDLIDIARQFLSDLFNLHAALLAEAWQAKDEEAFGREAETLRQILIDQEALLSSSDYFCLAPLLAKAQTLPGVPADYDERIRDILTVWAGKILDYAHRDYYELVRFYYRPRVEALLDHARSRLGKEETMASDEQLAPIYHTIEQAFVKTPFQVAEAEKYTGGPVQAVAEILARHGQGNRDKRTPIRAVGKE
ncbi:MAG: alpha-N-acetylglucosaminidase TIM-barrel domain-containing protein [Planctomycetota bacterium]